ncbi:MAG: hypothetical protein M9954_12700 [Cyclobacteriaceae bacterium]|nr:hypothetical protein [Cyclobacteriaceae bacterium]MCB9238097.1 hypothetical protein [Flammeovirgaceae bacterium]MCB0499517.1 hypothetical protein [Cyclobacteriaceae bacterium]MCO5272511.1 hypothetical protein [Cyclobacteriaceae bacterium]MCW5901579.1 hypothetical protein [Cyclobacteriaceae bacterium]
MAQRMALANVYNKANKSESLKVMDEKISLLAVEEYSDKFSAKIADGYFARHQKISGGEILKLCPSRQINLFVVRELLKTWKQETARYRSPYFNYEAPDVRDSLTRFQNALSNNISIARDHFLPLLKKGVAHTLFLVLNPYDFYSETLDKKGGGTIKVADLKSEVKYIKINQRPLETLVQKLEEKNTVSIAGNEAFAMLDQILEEVSFAPEDVGPFVAQLSAIVPLDVEALYEASGPSGNAPGNQPPARPIVNEQLQKGHVTTVADNFQKIPDLKNRLTINQKFMFTKILFNGDFDLFNNAIAKIDSLASLDEATSYLDSHYSNWDKETEEFEEFMDMVTKRFS